MNSIYIIGSSYWCNYLSNAVATNNNITLKVISWTSIRSILTLFGKHHSTVVVVGLGASLTFKRLIIWAILIAFLLYDRKKNRIISYWIGSDVLSLNDGYFSRAYISISKWLKVKNICGAPWFVSELRTRGIEADPVIFPYDTGPAARFATAPLPDEPLRICTYLPLPSWTDFGGPMILRVARRFPGVQWTVMGMTAAEVPQGIEIPANVSFMGWVSEPLAVQAASHVFLRLVEHDAFSGSVRDALALKRIVLYSLPVADTIQVSATDEKELAYIIETLADSRLRAGFVAARTTPGYRLPPYDSQISAFAAVLESDRHDVVS